MTEAMGMMRAAMELIADMAPAFHATEGIRDHVDPTDKTGWHVKGIETCADPLCVEAVRLLALRGAVPEADPLCVGCGMRRSDWDKPGAAFHEHRLLGAVPEAGSRGLDVERLARAMATVRDGHDAQWRDYIREATGLAREYAALAAIPETEDREGLRALLDPKAWAAHDEDGYVGCRWCHRGADDDGEPQHNEECPFSVVRAALASEQPGRVAEDETDG